LFGPEMFIPKCKRLDWFCDAVNYHSYAKYLFCFDLAFYIMCRCLAFLDATFLDTPCYLMLT